MCKILRISKNKPEAGISKRMIILSANDSSMDGTWNTYL